MHKSFRLAVAVVLFCCSLLAPRVALAYGACTDTYTQDGCHAGTHCDYYDDETDRWIGSVTVEYQC